MKTRLTLPFLLLLFIGSAIYGCGSTRDFVFTGTSNANQVVGGNEVLLKVEVDQTVPGAQTVALEGSNESGLTAMLKTFSRPAQAQSGFTLPGALVRAFNAAGEVVATSVVDSGGFARFENLPTGTYRFVITTNDPAVVLQTIASSSPDEATEVTADVTTTAATLIALEAGDGTFDTAAFEAAVNGDTPELQSLTAAVTAALESGTEWVSSDGGAVTSPDVSEAVEEAVSTLPSGGTGTSGGAVTTGTTGGGTTGGTGTTGGGTTGTGTTGGGTTGGTGTTGGGTTGGTGTTGGGTTGGGSSGTTGGQPQFSQAFTLSSMKLPSGGFEISLIVEADGVLQSYSSVFYNLVISNPDVAEEVVVDQSRRLRTKQSGTTTVSLVRKDNGVTDSSFELTVADVTMTSIDIDPVAHVFGEVFESTRYYIYATYSDGSQQNDITFATETGTNADGENVAVFALGTMTATSDAFPGQPQTYTLSVADGANTLSDTIEVTVGQAP